MSRIEDLNTDINIDSGTLKLYITDAKICTSTITTANITDLPIGNRIRINTDTNLEIPKESLKKAKIETSTPEKQAQRCLTIEDFIKMTHRGYRGA